MKTLLMFIALLGSSIAFGDTVSYRHTLLVGSTHFQTKAAPVAPYEYVDDIGFVVGYRLLCDYVGFGVEWSRFTVREGGSYPAEFRIDWIEWEVRARLGVTANRLRLSAMPGIGLGFQSGCMKYVALIETPTSGLGYDEIRSRGRQYFVWGLTAEATWPMSSRFHLGVGGFGRRLEDMSGFSPETAYPPKLSSVLGGYVALEYQH